MARARYGSCSMHVVHSSNRLPRSGQRVCGCKSVLRSICFVSITSTLIDRHRFTCTIHPSCVSCLVLAASHAEPDVRGVVHLSLTQTVEAYYQQTGELPALLRATATPDC